MQTAFKELIQRRRSVRRFKSQAVDRSALRTLIEAARLHPSAANKQPLVFIAVDEPEMVKDVTSTVKFAGYLPPEQKPGPEEAPQAYIIICQNKELALSESIRDVGAAAMTILLGACAHGLGACWMRSINFPKLAKILGLDDGTEIDSVIALGWPTEAPVVVEMKEGDVKYWLDESGLLHVPKRAWEEVTFLNGFNKSWD